MKDFLKEYSMIIILIILMGFTFGGVAVYESYKNEQLMKCRAKFSIEDCEKLVK